MSDIAITVTGTFTVGDFIAGNLEDFAEWCNATILSQGATYFPGMTYLPSAAAVCANAGISEVVIYNLNAEYGSRATTYVVPTPPA